AECHKKQNKDEQQGSRYDDLQTARRRLELLELSTPRNPVAGGKLDIIANRPFRVADKRTDITLANITRYNDSPLAVLAADFVWTERRLEVRDFAQGDESRLLVGSRQIFASRFLPMRKRHGHAAQGVEVGANILRQPHDQRERPIPLEDRPRFLASYGPLNNTLHVVDTQSIAGQDVSFNFDGEI